MKIKGLFKDKSFYKMVIMIALPIMIQNAITNFVNLLDNVMVGRLGTEQMSGVSIVNQIGNVANLCVFGAVSGAGIFTAQFFGKGDVEGQRQTFRFKVIISVIIATLFIIIAMTFNEKLIGFFLYDGSVEGDLQATLDYASRYHKIIAYNMVAFAITQAYSSNLRESGETIVPMLSGFIAITVNLIGNSLLIFGKLGCPELGVEGAAIASIISRVVECAFLAVYTYVKRERFTFIQGAYRHLFKIDKKLLKGLFAKSLPLIFNETLWSLGMTYIAHCYSMRGLDVVAGYSIASTVINVFNIAYMALGNAVGIIVGNYLGAGETEKAIETDRKLIAFSVAVGFVVGAIMLASSGLIPKIYNTSAKSKEIATTFIAISGLAMPLQAYLHSTYFTMRSGGKILITFLFDCGCVWCINVPAALILVKLTMLPVGWIYFICTFIEIIKAIIGTVLLRKKIWVNKIV